MGDGETATVRLKIRVAFRGATITSDAGLLAFRVLDDSLDLHRLRLSPGKPFRNFRHHLASLPRQSNYGGLAGLRLEPKV